MSVTEKRTYTASEIRELLERNPVLKALCSYPSPDIERVRQRLIASGTHVALRCDHDALDAARRLDINDQVEIASSELGISSSEFGFSGFQE